MAAPPPWSNIARPWADLPAELVDAVVARLDVFSAARLAAVCSPWARAAAANHAYLPFRKLCLLTSSHEDGDCIFNVVDLSAVDKIAPVPALLRPLRDWLWIGGKGCWLATGDEDCNAQLVNPYTGDRVDLPAVATIPDVEPSGYGCKVRHVPWDYTFRKIAVCDTPSSSSGGDGGGYLFIAVVTSRLLAVARGGDRSWTALKNHRALSLGYDDAIVHKGKAIAVDGSGSVFAWDLRAVPCPEPERVSRGGGNHGEVVYQWNLAESADGRRLLLACTFGSYVRYEKDTGNLKPVCFSPDFRATSTVNRFQGDGVRLYELDIDAAAAGCGAAAWTAANGAASPASATVLCSSARTGRSGRAWAVDRRGSSRVRRAGSAVRVPPTRISTWSCTIWVIRAAGRSSCPP